MTAAWPSCSVDPPRAPSGGSCHTVWPWLPMASTSAGRSEAEASVLFTAAPIRSPSSKSSAQIAAALPAVMALAIRPRAARS